MMGGTQSYRSGCEAAGPTAILRRGRRAMILLVVLVIVSLLAILGTTFAYRMRADLSAVTAQSNDLQAELAAEAGIERAKLVLRQTAMERSGLLARTGQGNQEPWYDNREAFRQIIVWTPGQLGGKTGLDQNVVEGQPAWRFSVITPNTDVTMTASQGEFRYGLTDEAGKLNLNTATREQLISLFEQLQVENVTPQQLADCLLDWRSPGETPRENGAKTSYYQTLNPPYKCKGAPLESVEEVLLIKNFNGQILYGEDYNHNGHLEPNEDDGEDGLFPPDNGDNILNRGLYAYATVYSRDMNSANDNRPRLNINAMNLAQLPEETRQIVEQEIPNIEEILTFVQQAKAKGHKFESVAELLVDVKVTKPTSRPATQPAGGKGATGGSGTTGGSQQGVGTNLGRSSSRVPSGTGGRLGESGASNSGRNGNTNNGGNRRNSGSSGNQGTGGSKIQRQQQSRRNDGSNSDSDEQQAPTESDLNPDNSGQGQSAFQDQGQQPQQDQTGDQNMQPDASAEQGGDSQNPPEEEVVETIPTPVQPGDMPGIMNRLTTATSPILSGLINVNSAPREVLMTLPEMTEQEADGIVAARQSLDADARKTPAWLVTQNLLSPEKFAKIGKYLTARSLQFTIESIGFADHVGTFRRLQVVVEMRGQVEQVLYWRDISALGAGYPLREDEWKNGIASGNR